MTADMVMDIMRNALYIASLMVVVIIVPSLIVGLIVAMFQAATQINEQTLSFLPRLLITLAVLSIAGPWLGNLLYEFTHRLILDLPGMLR